jgi:hypothetical protein
MKPNTRDYLKSSTISSSEYAVNPQAVFCQSIDMASLYDDWGKDKILDKEK